MAVLLVMGAEQKKTRRSPASGGRRRTIRVSVSAGEYALIEAAAAREGMANAAWLGEVGVRAATPAAVPAVGAAVGSGPDLTKLMMVCEELTALRRGLRNVGGNLNDIARHVNTTGQLLAQTRWVQARVGQVVDQVEVNLAELRGVVTASRRSERAVADGERWRRL